MHSFEIGNVETVEIFTAGCYNLTWLNNIVILFALSVRIRYAFCMRNLTKKKKSDHYLAKRLHLKMNRECNEQTYSIIYIRLSTCAHRLGHGEWQLLAVHGRLVVCLTSESFGIACVCSLCRSAIDISTINNSCEYSLIREPLMSTMSFLCNNDIKKQTAISYRLQLLLSAANSPNSQRDITKRPN